jgi:hypothetical protein
MGWNDHDEKLQRMLDQGVPFDEAYRRRVDDLLDGADVERNVT